MSISYGVTRGFGHQGNCHCRRGLGQLAALGDFGGAAAAPHYPPNLEIEPVATKIWANLDLDGQQGAFRVVHTVIGRTAGVRTLVLDGVDFLDLEVRDLANAPVKWSYDSAKITITWNDPFVIDEHRMIEVRYRVEKPASGLFFMKPTAKEPLKPYFAATDHETELARYWLACVDLPNVRTSLEFNITAAANFTILANGKLITEEIKEDGKKTAVWRLEERCPSYLICFVVGDLVRFGDGDFCGIPIAYFACKDFTPRDLERTFGRTGEMLAWITGKLGVPFPFPKYYQFALPEFGGAMENISLVSWSDQFMLTERSAAEGTWLVDQVNVHEMAHAYFGDLVVCRDFAHAWLKESWATYMESCWLEDKRGSDEQRYDLYCNAKAYFTEADDHYARPLVTRNFTSSWQMYDRHLYPGGACRLHTLRWELGDHVFWRAVTDYLQTHREQVVETHDWQRVLEKHSGRSLQQLFDQWIYKPGYPDIKVSFSYDAERKLGTFEVTQKQVEAQKDASPFTLTTELGWTVKGELHLREVKITAARHSFDVPMADEPEQVRFDPRGRILHKLEFDPGEKLLKKQLVDAPDAVGRIQASVHLCASGKRSHIADVIKAYSGETFWGVRKEMLGALADTNSELALTAIVDIIGSERDPMVLPEVFDKAACYRDERIQQAVIARLGRGDLGPQAVAAAYGALAAQRENAPIQTLEIAAAKTERTSGQEQAAALRSLGATRSEETLQFLLEHSWEGKTPYRARAGAIQGLGKLVPHVNKAKHSRIVERLTELLRDSELNIRLEAAKSLGLARAQESIAYLEALRSTLPLQQKVTVDRILADIKKTEDSILSQTQRQVDELQVKLRKLSERVQFLEDKR